MTRGVRTRGMRSKFESRVEEALGAGWQYETHRLGYTLHNNYVPDFSLPLKGIHIEAKGRFTGPDRRKMLAVKGTHPESDIRLVFMRDQKLYKGSPTTYTQWATKHGFKNSVFPALPFTKEEQETLCAKSKSGTSSTPQPHGRPTAKASASRPRRSPKPKSARRAGSTSKTDARQFSRAWPRSVKS